MITSEHHRRLLSDVSRYPALWIACPAGHPTHVGYVELELEGLVRIDGLVCYDNMNWVKFTVRRVYGMPTPEQTNAMLSETLARKTPEA